MAEDAPEVLGDLKPKNQEDLQPPVTEKIVSWHIINTNEILKKEKKSGKKIS